MRSNHHDHLPETDLEQDAPSEDERDLISRRTMLRRSMLGVTGIGLASLLAACGDEDDEDDIDEDVDDQEEEAENEEEEDNPSGIEDIDDAPAGEDPEPAGG